MDINTDELRRQARDTQDAHRESMRSFPRMIDQLWSDHKATSSQRDAAVLNGLSRRGFFRIGGITIASGAVLAACGNDSSSSAATDVTTTTAAASSTTAAPTADATDVLILKTASSLERLAIAVYQKAIDNASALGIQPAVGAVATLFQMQHTDHANVFEKATTDAGAKAFTDPNPAVLQAIQPQIDALKTQADVLNLAYMLEIAAAETYQSTVGVFKNTDYNAVAASVGGVESRHVAILGHAIDPSFAKSITNGLTVGFQKTDQAVKAGTGVS